MDAPQPDSTVKSNEQPTSLAVTPGAGAMRRLFRLQATLGARNALSSVVRRLPRTGMQKYLAD